MTRPTHWHDACGVTPELLAQSKAVIKRAIDLMGVNSCSASRSRPTQPRVRAPVWPNGAACWAKGVSAKRSNGGTTEPRVEGLTAAVDLSKVQGDTATDAKECGLDHALKLDQPARAPHWRRPRRARGVLCWGQELGYGYITVGDHVLGVGPERAARLAARSSARRRSTTIAWHGTSRSCCRLFFVDHQDVELMHRHPDRAARQTALLAKQAAEADVLSGGRVRLVHRQRYNDVEYEALGVPLRQAGQIIGGAVRNCYGCCGPRSRRLRRRVPQGECRGDQPFTNPAADSTVVRGQSPAVLRRVGRVGDGWFPSIPTSPRNRVRADLDVIHESARDAGRDPLGIGLEGAIYFYSKRFDMLPGGRLPPLSWRMWSTTRCCGRSSVHSLLG